MGLLDKFKEKAEGLVQGVKDQVSDATGVDADKLIETAGSVTDAGESLADAAESFQEGREKLAGA